MRTIRTDVAVIGARRTPRGATTDTAGRTLVSSRPSFASMRRGNSALYGTCPRLLRTHIQVEIPPGEMQLQLSPNFKCAEQSVANPISMFLPRLSST